jgi:hypothetical protein
MRYRYIIIFLYTVLEGVNVEVRNRNEKIKMNNDYYCCCVGTRSVYLLVLGFAWCVCGVCGVCWCVLVCVGVCWCGVWCVWFGVFVCVYED